MGGDLANLTRREFLQTAAASIGAGTLFSILPSTVSAASSIKTILDITGIDVKVIDWQPKDLTDIVNKIVAEKKVRITNSSSPIKGCELVLLEVSEDHLRSDPSLSQLGGLFLHDPALNRYLSVDLSEICSGVNPLNNQDDCISFTQLANNGNIKYYRGPYVRGIRAAASVIYVDTSSGKMIIIRDKFYRGRTYDYARLSGEGKRGFFPVADKGYIWEIDGLTVAHQFKGVPIVANYDASVLVALKEGGYYREEVGIAKPAFVFKSRGRWEWLDISPNGKFIAMRSEVDPKFPHFKVYVHETGERFSIFTGQYLDQISGIGDSGLLETSSATFTYANGNYGLVKAEKGFDQRRLAIKPI
jgi:hypothetical protein